MTYRQSMLDFISQRLAGRDLVWAGLRSDDIEAISDLEQLAGSFSIVGGNCRGGNISTVDFEDISGDRPDLDNWDIEDYLDTAAAHEFRESMLRRLASPTALLPYRPSGFISALLFARRDQCLSLGLFGAHQAIFEHKPWVETMVEDLGIPRIEWKYVADEELSKVRSMLSEGPIMLRASRSAGGAGLVRVDDPERLDESWPRHHEAFLSVTPYLTDAVPINIGATVWHDGVTMRHPSVQLIGIPDCTNRPFGYCGNDFGLAAELDTGILDSVESSVVALGQWLRQYGYRGTFGVDFLIHHGVSLFTEINPRFQGSTYASSRLSREAGESCIILDHIAAMLGHDAPESSPLTQIARALPAFAQFVVHWTGPPAAIDSSAIVAALHAEPARYGVDLATKSGVTTQTGGVVVRATVRDRVTNGGFDLRDPWARIVSSEIATMRRSVCEISNGALHREPPGVLEHFECRQSSVDQLLRPEPDAATRGRASLHDSPASVMAGDEAVRPQDL